MTTKMVTAIAAGDDTRAVAAEVVTRALNKMGDRPVSLALVFAANNYDYQVILDVIRDRTNGAPLIGCSSAGEFTEERDAKKSLALSLVSSDTHTFFTAIGHNLNADPTACLNQATSAFPKEVPDHPHFSALFFIDGLAGRGEEAVMAATLSLGPMVRYAGGSAADGLDFKRTFVFVDDQVATDSAGLCLIASKKHPVIGFQHGHIPFSDTLKSTRAEGSVLYEVDGRPAWDVWKDSARDKARELGIDVDALSSDTDVGQFLIRYELGLSTGSQYKVRVPLSKNKDGSLNFACTIPEGASFKIMESRVNDQIRSAREAADNATANLKDTTIAGAFIFDCVCRGIILQDDFHRGIQGIKEVIGPVPLIGFETYGEICKEEGQFSGFHNTSTVVMLLPD